eukprot:Clim_evm74s201 gene=Clim_evmTU74s201
MPKNKWAKGANHGSLGKALIRQHQKGGMVMRDADGFVHHSTEIEDGNSWNKYRSVTEQNDLEEFFTDAQLAGRDFTAERQNFRIVRPEESHTAFRTPEQRQRMEAAMAEHIGALKIPRRPQWDESTSAEQLHEWERESFLEWRRELAELQSNENLELTPFERNIEVWRQLWRVVERSDVVIQIVDARNPLQFRCRDLELYVKEHGVGEKANLLLVNKADMLTPEQRKLWAAYFQKNAIEFAFWSAGLEEARQAAAKREQALEVERAVEEEEDEDGHDSEDEDEEQKAVGIDEAEGTPTEEEPDSHLDEQDKTIEELMAKVKSQTLADHPDVADGVAKVSDEDIKILSRKELLDLLWMKYGKTHHGDLNEEDDDLESTKPEGPRFKVGLVGYPNVGKSSTINALVQYKTVAVSSTPGKTKHFQTIALKEEDILLIDCPGLVFPSFSSTKADMVVDGILPIDQLRDSVGPIALICERIPKHVLEYKYGIVLKGTTDGGEAATTDAGIQAKEDRPGPHDLLQSYARMRGYMSSHGMPDESRGARYILKDYVNARLLFCHPPPGVDAHKFNETNADILHDFGPAAGKKEIHTPDMEKGYHRGPQNRATLFTGDRAGHKPQFLSKVDRDFMRQMFVQAKGKAPTTAKSSQALLDDARRQAAEGLQSKKHHKKNKRGERKLRRKMNGSNPYES